MNSSNIIVSDLVENVDSESATTMEQESVSQFCPFEQKAMDSYDEDLNENPFFQSLLSTVPDLFSQCVLEQWLICVPRRDSLPKYAFTLEDFTHHILKPIEAKNSSRHWSGGSTSSNNSSVASLLQQPSSSCGSFLSDRDPSISFISCSGKTFETYNDEADENQRMRGNWNYITLTHINVEFTGQTLILDLEVPILNSNDKNSNGSSTGGFVQIRKEVLFDETFYTNDRRKYKVLCVASPLNSKVDIEDEEFGNSGLGLWNLTSLRDCIDFIWVKGTLKILETYDAYVKLFLHNHPALESLPLPIQKNLVYSLYLKCMEYATESTDMIPDNNPSLSEFLLLRLRLATETYVLNGVYRSLISSVTSVTSSQDAFINKITRNLSEIHPQDLEIDSSYWNILGQARYELNRISSYSSPLGKLSCMKRTVRHLRVNSVSEGGDASILTTEKLIPIWVYLIIKTPLGNWAAQLEFLRGFRFSAVDQADNENSFFLTTLEASLEYLKSGKVLGISENERDIGSMCELGEAWLYSLHKEAYESNNPKLAEMLELIRLGNCQRLEECIEEYEVERYEHNKKQKEPVEIDPESLCHPLCQCKECVEKVLNAQRNEAPMPAAVALTTDDELTLLHVACIYGRPKVVDFLIGSGACLEAKDAQEMTALHYAASRGHQNALLLLLHAGCDLQPLNNSKNTPLHMAAQNGHEGCVKALIYYAEHVGKNMNLSVSNSKGDTPLHFASRWGFIGIVNILTEHGASITVSNLRHSTPIDCAHDSHVLKILQRSLRRRSLVQINHGDFINIEMISKEDSSGIVMLISEPTTSSSPSATEQEKNKLTMVGDSSSKSNSRAASRLHSRRPSVGGGSMSNLYVSSQSAPRSRKISAVYNFSEDASKLAKDETEKCLLSVAEHLQNESDPRNSDFVLNYFDDLFDPTEQEHIRKVSVQKLDDSDEEKLGIEEDRNIQKIFKVIRLGDVPLTLFYLGIPSDEIDIVNADSQSSKSIAVIPPCHPLCPCKKCVAKIAGLGLGLDILNQEGLSPLHVAVQNHVLVLVKVLIKYGANINLQSTFEKKTALDFSIERGFHDIEDILLACGALPSTSFCPAPPIDYEK